MISKIYRLSQYVNYYIVIDTVRCGGTLNVDISLRFTYVHSHAAQTIFFQFTFIVLQSLHRSPDKGYCRRRWSTLHKRIAICQLFLVTCSLRFNWSRVGDCNFVRDSDMNYAACSLIYNSNVQSTTVNTIPTLAPRPHTIDVQTLHVRPFSLPYT